MSVCASNQRGNWSTGSLRKTNKSAYVSIPASLSKVTPSCREVDWSLKIPMIPFIHRASCPFHFLSTTLPFCSCPSNEEVRHRHRHNTPLHEEGMSVCQMGRGDYNMFPLPWWLNGAGMRTDLIHEGSFPWQNYESQFLGRKYTYQQHLGEGDPWVNTVRVIQKRSTGKAIGEAIDLTDFGTPWSLNSNNMDTSPFNFLVCYFTL